MHATVLDATLAVLWQYVPSARFHVEIPGKCNKYHELRTPCRYEKRWVRCAACLPGTTRGEWPVAYTIAGGGETREFAARLLHLFPLPCDGYRVFGGSGPPPRHRLIRPRGPSPKFRGCPWGPRGPFRATFCDGIYENNRFRGAKIGLVIQKSKFYLSKLFYTLWI